MTAKLSTAVRAFTFAFLLTVLFTAACKPAVGSSCEKGEARCTDPKTELACQAGRFIETPCRGPGGCELTLLGTRCDFSANQSGDACSADDEGAASCANRDVMLSCHGGRYASLPCRGPQGCVNTDGRAQCDTSLAEPADPCRAENLKACSYDGTQVLICKQGAMQHFYLCRGPAGCKQANGKLKCDTSLAKVGDACDQKLEGEAFACTPDQRAILGCKGGAFALDEACKAGQKCTALTGGTRCGPT